MQRFRSLTVILVLYALTAQCLGSELHLPANQGGGKHDGNRSRRHGGIHEVHVQLTELKLADFSHRGGLHVDRIELRSEPNDRNAFFINNPTDPSYPLWAAPPASMAQVWPRPRFESRRQHSNPAGGGRHRTLLLSRQLRLRLLGGAQRDELCRLAAGRFARRAFADVAAVSDDPADALAATSKLGGNRTIDSLIISVRNETFLQYPHLDMREDYELRVEQTGIRLTAQENWGVLRGLETIAQLFFVARIRPDQILIHENRIEDRPAFKYRGFMMDSARHYIQKTTLMENLEAMAMNKMNAFHWHIVDDQSFPYLSRKFPQLAAKSAFAGGKYYYTADDIVDVVEFARQRGIRVIPEFDAPDHTHSWGHALPDLASWCPYNGLAYMGPLDPSRPATFQFLAELYAEVSELFPDTWLHLGMDEVSLDCWRLNATIGKFMRDKKIPAHEHLVVYFANRLAGIVENLPNRRGITVWEDIIDKDNLQYPLKLPSDTIVQVWITRDASKLDKWRQRFRLIRSEEWYLDHRGYGADWVKRYRFRPAPGDLGGEACMWTEFQSDQTVTPRAWPSVSAVAEQLWSGEAATEPVEAASRIEEQNCRMMARGIRVGVAGGPAMCQSPLSQRPSDWTEFEGHVSRSGRGVLTSEILMAFSHSPLSQEWLARLKTTAAKPGRYCWLYQLACWSMITAFLLSKLAARLRLRLQRQQQQQHLSTLSVLLWRSIYWVSMKCSSANGGVLVLALLSAYSLGWIVLQILAT